MAKFNLSGWNWKSWLKANKSNLRLIVSGVLGLIAVGFSGLSAPWAISLGGVVTAVCKLVLDTFDFYLSE